MRKLLLIPLLLILGLITVNAQLTVNDAIAVYQFEEGSGLNCTDSTINNLSGTLNGTTFISSKGTNTTGNFATRYDGVDDFCQVLDNDLLNLTMPFSISLWINKTDVGSTEIAVYKNVQGTDSSFGISIDGVEQVNVWQKVLGESDRSQRMDAVFIPTDQWIHIVAIVNGTTGSDAFIYIDAVQQVTVSGAIFGFDASDEDFYIGTDADLISDFTGDIDEVYIFNFSLSQNEITDLFNNGLQAVGFNTTNLDVFLSKNPVEILEQFVLFANYTNATSGLPVLNATCFANSSRVGGGSAGFGRGILGIGGLSTLGNAVHTQVNDIFGNNILRVDIDNIPLGKASYAVNFRFHAHNQTPTDNLRILATCHPNNLSFSNFTFLGQVNTTEAVISTSTGNDTIWGFSNVVLFGAQVASPNCSVIFESINTSIDKHWMIADTTTNLNLDNSFTSIDFGETYVIRPNAFERSPFVDAGFGLDVPNETTMQFNSTSGLYFLDNIRHGRPFDFNDTVFCSAVSFDNATDFVITNVQDNVAPIVQIVDISPFPVIINISNVTIQWTVNDPELVANFINVSFPNGSLLIQTELKPLILTTSQITVLGNYSVVAFANDTGGLTSTDNATFEVQDLDLIPPVLTLVSPSNSTRNNSVPLNITFTVTDNNLNALICTLRNTTFLFDSGTFAQSVNSIIVLAKGETALDQNFPSLELRCFDNTILNNSAVLSLNYTLDTVPPIISPINPTNNKRFNRDVFSSISVKANCTDAPVFRFNITIQNDSDRIASFESRSPVNNFIIIDDQLTISNLGVGNYSVNHTCADPHTKQLIGDYDTRKNSTDFDVITYDTGSSKFEIKYIRNSLSINDFGTSKLDTNDKYKFWFNTNQTESKTKRTFIFEIISNKPVYYLENSKYNGHFITGNNWIDFELEDEDATYSVTKNGIDNFEVSVTTSKTSLEFESVGDLNVISVITQFEIFSITQITDFFSVTECPTETGAVLLLSLFFIIAFLLIAMGITTRIGFIGFFGALMLLFTALRVVACIRIVATLMIFLSLLFLFFFIFRGVFSNVFTGKTG